MDNKIGQLRIKERIIGSLDDKPSNDVQNNKRQMTSTLKTEEMEIVA